MPSEIQGPRLGWKALVTPSVPLFPPHANAHRCAVSLSQSEDDESLTADEKALLRFQKQRLRETAGSKFALPDDDEGGGGGEQLTHLGRSLAELEDLQEVGRRRRQPPTCAPVPPP